MTIKRAFLCLCLLSLSAHADTIVIQADPTGAVDATPVFKAAALATFTQLRAVDSVGGRAGSAPKIVIPNGRYTLTDEICFGPFVEIEGQGKPVIKQTNPAKSGFIFANCVDVSVKNVQFSGGISGLALGNPNIDCTQYVIRDCRFFVTTGPAILAKSLDATGVQSAQLMISDCQFRACYSAVQSDCDQVTIEKSWICWTDAVNVNNCCLDFKRGSNKLSDCMLIPSFSDSYGHWWVNSRGSFHAERTKFGGEGAGLAVLHHGTTIPSTAYPYQGELVSLRDSQLSAGPGNRTDSGVITLDGGLPAITTFDGNNYIVDVPWIQDTGNLPNVIPGLKPGQVKLRLSPNGAWPATPWIPDSLKPFVIP